MARFKIFIIMVQSQFDLVVDRFRKDVKFSISILSGFVDEDVLRSYVNQCIDDVISQSNQSE